MEPIVVYTKPLCGYCGAVKRLFNSRNIAFEERHITDPGEMAALKERYQHATFPMVIIRGRCIGGYTDTVDLMKQGLFEPLLRGETV
ncbi:MAG: hypothetical protein GMKNLPBB_03171 [Myxococcota bacterium]|nr:hypothetical protein [Myxococcota bacterium]